MRISTSHRVIFMHVQRTGGSSVITALRPIWAAPSGGRINKLASRFGLLRDPGRIKFRAHDTLPFVQKRLTAEVFADYLKVAFVRNPYSWLTSMYSTYKRGPNHRHHPTVAAMSGFGEYIDWEIERQRRFQDLFLLDDKGDVAVDFVGRFETLADDYARLCKRIDFVGAELPHKNQNRFRDYREFYTDEIRDKVTKFWSRDIKLLGYDFDGNRLSCPLDDLA